MEAAPKLAEKPAKAPARPGPGAAAPQAAGGATAGGKKGSPAGRKTAKEAAGAGKHAKSAGGQATAEHVPGVSAKERARLAAVSGRAAEKKTSTTTHQTAEQATGDARTAVKEPQVQADGQALGDHAQVLQDNPPPDPLIVLKVMRIKWAIRAKRPVDEDDLGKAKPKDMAEEAGKEVSTDVQSSAKSVQTGYAAVGEKPSGTVTQTGGSMPAEGAAPASPDIHATSAVPDAVKPAEVSLAADKQGVDTKAKDAKLDREEVGLIKEGPVAEARDAQGELGKLAIWGPDAVLKSDKELRASASSDFQKAEATALKKMHEARLQKLADAHEKKDATKTGEEERRQKLGEKLQGIYAAAEDKVKAKLEPLTTTALKMWDDGIKPLSDNFDNAIGRVDEIIKEHKSHWYNRAVDFVAGLPDWIVERYETAEKKFADGAGELAFTISSWVNGIIRDCQKIISDARAAISREIEGLEPELKTWALEQKQVIDKQFDKLAADAEMARQNFTKELGKKLTASVREKDAKIQKLREMSKGLLQKFADFVSEFIDDPLRAIVNGLLRILGIPPEAFWAMVEKFGKVVDQIADKPRVFANNLVAAIKLGFQQFKDNIVSHLLKGLLTWLTSKLKDAGVQPPPDFSLKSVVTFILQIIGVSWPKIRGKLVKYIGEQNMKRIELAVQLLTTFINEGWDGLWKLIQDKFDPQTIVDAVLEAVKNYIVETIVKQAAVRIIALFNPVGAVLQALELIYKAITWVLDNAAKIFTFIDAVVSGVANIMSGAIGGAANLIEKALGMLVPVVIDLFAKLLGLGDLPDKVKEVVGNLQAVVDKAIDKVIAWIAGKIGLKKEEDKKTEGAIGIEVAVTAPDESHKLYFDKEGDKAVLKIASVPTKVGPRLVDFRKRIKEIAETKRSAILGKITDAEKLVGSAEDVADKIVQKFRQSQDPEVEEKKAEADEVTLGSLLSEIYAAFGDKPLPSVLWAKELGKMHDSLGQTALIAELDQAAKRDEILALATWSEVRSWLEARPLFARPLSGKLKQGFWKILAEQSGEIKLGLNHKFTDQRYFGALEKADLTSEVDGGGQVAIKGALVKWAFVGSGPSLGSLVKAYLKQLSSSSISHETGAASGAVAPYAYFGAWDGSRLGFAYPKHVSWKDGPASKKRTEMHHIWPRYLLGDDILTVPMVLPLHRPCFHDLERALTPFSYNRKASVKLAATPTLKATFWADAALHLQGAYTQFQIDHVRVGAFDSYCIGVIMKTSPSKLAT